MHPHIPKLQELLRGLADHAGLTPKVVVSPSASHAGDRSAWDPTWIPFDEFVQSGKQSKLGRTATGEIEWARMGFDWPLWILFSSGTTGAWCRQTGQDRHHIPREAHTGWWWRLTSFGCLTRTRMCARFGNRQAKVRRSGVAKRVAAW